MLIAGQQFFRWSFYLPLPTQQSIFATQVLSCAHAVEPTFFTTVDSFQGGSKHGKTHTIVYKGSFLHFPKVQISLFLKLYTQASVVLQEHHLFHKGSAVLSLQTLTQNHNISANFKQFFASNANECSGSALPTIQ